MVLTNHNSGPVILFLKEVVEEVHSADNSQVLKSHGLPMEELQD